MKIVIKFELAKSQPKWKTYEIVTIVLMLTQLIVSIIALL